MSDESITRTVCLGASVPSLSGAFICHSASPGYESAMRWIVIALFLAFSAAALPGPALADHYRARDAVTAGQVQPLGKIMRQINPRYPGRLLDAQLGQRGRNGRWIYLIKILDNRGSVQLLTVDAKSGRVLKVRGR